MNSDKKMNDFYQKVFEGFLASNYSLSPDTDKSHKVTRVSFEIPYCEWLKIQESDEWVHFARSIQDIQKKHNQQYPHMLDKIWGIEGFGFYNNQDIQNLHF